ncbi:EAL domain-containing protein [Xanthobacteraceae bacterium Astr-EGSB]|uniref:putative bifunctional diguanylate cyclase/phosphodiesterase n=1 Tax=Astrobacterium formosum TaxID=3069710 RepID=UPI0027B82F23|nr:EAL domain-containing protein [Xanthobacteraceae bacterium Astr-EGSB]
MTSSTEHLRESLVALERENERLRVESAHATLLFRSLDALARAGLEADPFTAVFSALKDVFSYSQAMVLAHDYTEYLICIAASPEFYIGSSWKVGVFFQRVMSGRVAATFSNQDLTEWRTAPKGLSDKQPALYLPIQMRGRRGLLVLLQDEGGKGFDRADVTLGQKFTLLASSALGIRESIENVAELRRKEEVEIQNMKFDAALNNISHGLIMFDSEKKVVVCNKQFTDMYNLSSQNVKTGCALREILRLQLVTGFVPKNCSAFLADIDSSIKEDKGLEDEIRFRNGRIFKICSRPMPDGGWVATHEDVTERRINEERIAFLAMNDVLTGIANRSRFIEELNVANDEYLSSGSSYCIFMLDLDRFKNVNDSLGHAAGDLLLRETAKRLQQLLPSTDTLARLGGDEFAVLHRSAPGSLNDALRESARQLAERIIDAISQPYNLDDTKVVVGVSVGIALASRDSGGSDELMKRADLALYKIKSSGRNGFAFFDTKMATEAHERQQLESDLHEAIVREELELYFQPIVSVTNHQVRSLEALVRWHHPTQGLIMPDRFIPLAEEVDLINTIGQWILETACQQATSWPSDVKLAVNVSPVQFQRGSLVAVVKNALKTSCLPGERLELEITERVLLENQSVCDCILRKLKALGVSIVLDDFGTGYSSLSYLTMFPFSKIKIDKSFIQRMVKSSDSGAIVCAVANLGHSLNIATTAEGIETAEQLKLVAAAGVSEVQGYLFGRPATVSQIGRFFERRENRRLASSKYNSCQVK